MDELSSTIKSYLASICNLLITNGFQNIAIYSPRVELTLIGIKCSKGSTVSGPLLWRIKCYGLQHVWASLVLQMCRIYHHFC